MNNHTLFFIALENYEELEGLRIRTCTTELRFDFVMSSCITDLTTQAVLSLEY